MKRLTKKQALDRIKAAGEIKWSIRDIRELGFWRIVYLREGVPVLEMHQEIGSGKTRAYALP